MRSTNILIFLILIYSSSLVAQNHDLYTIDLSGKEKKAEDMNLSSIASDIDYIPLETTKESYLTGVFRLIKTSENLLVLDYNNMKYTRLLIFDLEGKFEAIIEEAGKGPGEYASISDFTFDPETQLITILDSFRRKVLQFSLSGEFIREKVLDIRVHNMTYIKPGYFCFLIPLSMVTPDKDGKLYNLFVMDQDFNLIKRIASPSEEAEPENSLIRIVGGLDTFDDQLRLKLTFSDAAYTFNKNLELDKIIQFDMGKYRLPASVYSSLERSRRERKKYKSLNGFTESDKHFYFKYRFQNQTFAFIQNKIGGDIINLSGNRGNFGIVNDFDGSMKFWPKGSTAPDELIQFYNAIDLIEQCDKNAVKKFKSEFPEQQSKLLKVLDQVDEESNPIIQIVKLK